MIEIVIAYDQDKQVYKIYEPSTDSLMVSANLTEALVVLNKFLKDQGLSDKDLLECDNISYHLDSATMKSVIEGNLTLIKRLQSAPSGFMKSAQKFGSTTTTTSSAPPKDMGKKKKSGSSGFSGALGFQKSYKKFGGSKF